jgi:hypothetical protein
MSLLQNEYKNSFKVVLDSNQVGGVIPYTGIQFNATYQLNLLQQISAQDIDRPYAVSWAFRSVSSTSATSGLSMSTLYALYLNFANKPTNSIQPYNSQNYAGILCMNNDFTSYSIAGPTTTTPLYFDTKISDNAPLIVNSLRNMTSINLNVVNMSNNTTFNAANTGGINTATTYVCVLTFTQI